MRALNQVRDALQSRGLINTFKLILNVSMDYLFDLRYGTDTTRPVDLTHLEIKSENKSHGNPYESSKFFDLKRIFRKLNFPNQSVLVDLGAGKGKVILAASEFPFKRIVGIEFSKELCDIAERNVKVYSDKLKYSPSIKILNQDVTKYQFEGDENVFFMFNPFSADILNQFLDSLQSSLDKNPRQTWIIYGNPVHSDCFSKRPFKVKEDIFFMGSRYLILFYEPST